VLIVRGRQTPGGADGPQHCTHRRGRIAAVRDNIDYVPAAVPW
jgi:hypothetical protein